MAATTKGHRLVPTPQALFIANSLIWIAIGTTTVVRMVGERPKETIAIWVMGALMAGNAAAMAPCAIGLGRGGRLFSWLALVVLGVNIVLTVTDQFGPLDLVTLVINVALAGLVVGIDGRKEKARDA